VHWLFVYHNSLDDRSAQVFRFSFRCMTAIAGKLCYGDCHSTIPLEFPSCNCNGTKTPALTVGYIKRIVINKTAATQPEMCERGRIHRRDTRLQAFCERSRKRNFWCLSRPDAHCKKKQISLLQRSYFLVKIILQNSTCICSFFCTCHIVKGWH